MSASFRTDQLKGRRKVLIDDHEYTVRRLSNVDQLEYRRAIRELAKISKIEKERELTEAEQIKIDDLSYQLVEINISLFDDGGDQSKSRKLISSLSDSEFSELMRKVFSDEIKGVEGESTAPATSTS